MTVKRAGTGSDISLSASQSVSQPNVPTPDDVPPASEHSTRPTPPSTGRWKLAAAPAPLSTFDGTPRTPRAEVIAFPAGMMAARDEPMLQSLRNQRSAFAATTISYADSLTFKKDFAFSPETAMALVEASEAFYEEKELGVRLAKQWGFEDVHPITRTTDVFQGLPLPDVIKKLFVRDVQAAVAASPEVIVLGFRGTESGNIADLATDLAVLRPSETEYGKVHRGFSEAKNLIIGELLERLEVKWRRDLAAGKPPRPVYLTGHSMGGALATLAAPDVSKLIIRLKTEFPDQQFDIGGVYTFGSPRPGTKSFARSYRSLPASTSGATLADRTFAVAIEGDPIVDVPHIFHSWTHASKKNLHAFRARVGEKTDRRDTLAIEAVTVGRKSGAPPDPAAPAPISHHLLVSYRRLMRELVRRPELVRPNGVEAD